MTEQKLRIRIRIGDPDEDLDRRMDEVYRSVASKGWRGRLATIVGISGLSLLVAAAVVGGIWFMAWGGTRVSTVDAADPASSAGSGNQILAMDVDADPVKPDGPTAASALPANLASGPASETPPEAMDQRPQGAADSGEDFSPPTEEIVATPSAPPPATNESSNVVDTPQSASIDQENERPTAGVANLQADLSVHLPALASTQDGASIENSSGALEPALAARIAEPNAEADLTPSDQASSVTTVAPSAQETTSTMGESVVRAQFTSAIKSREPVDRIEPPIIVPEQKSRNLFYFTELRGLKGHHVRHTWKFRNEVMATLEFSVGGDRWRVYSSKHLMPNASGRWSVLVQDDDGSVLAVNEFDVVARP